MTASFKTYRNRATGVVGDYPPRLAANFPDLIPVEKGAKPLAYVPIPAEVVEAIQTKLAEDADDTENDESVEGEE